MGALLVEGSETGGEDSAGHGGVSLEQVTGA